MDCGKHGRAHWEEDHLHWNPLRVFQRFLLGLTGFIVLNIWALTPFICHARPERDHGVVQIAHGKYAQILCWKTPEHTKIVSWGGVWCTVWPDFILLSLCPCNMGTRLPRRQRFLVFHEAIFRDREAPLDRIVDRMRRPLVYGFSFASFLFIGSVPLVWTNISSVYLALVPFLSALFCAPVAATITSRYLNAKALQAIMMRIFVGVSTQLILEMYDAHSYAHRIHAMLLLYSAYFYMGSSSSS